MKEKKDLCRITKKEQKCSKKILLKREKDGDLMFLKKISKILLSCSLILLLFSVSSTAYADSGASALPPKQTALEKYYYSKYAPKTQTEYKKFETVTMKVSTVKKQSKSLEVTGTRIMAGGAILGAIATKVPPLAVPAAVVGGTGGTIYFIGHLGKVKYDKFKSDAVIKHITYFKWTNAKKFEYSVKIESWVEYKGEKVSKVKTSYFNKSL